jgi:ferrochelatase
MALWWILLANTGSPAAPLARRCGELPEEFWPTGALLIYPWLWRPILYGIILNTRPKRSARLYRRIWTPQGSPLR